MDIQSILAKRRDAGQHTPEELWFLATGAGKGTIPDYQLAAWLMAAYLNPLDVDETAWLTVAMADSGERMDLEGLPKPWVDKHSTGGVGDKTTLVLLPLLAACGLTVLKMSGRGLGITGGTIDKLSAVPGFRTDLAPSELKEQAKRIGIALTGQTPDLAPADKALYALRDVTATVASIPLIVSSILSKKIAGGAETIVLDVKCGSGAFMPNLAEARKLADALQETGTRCGVTVRVAISDMDQPLGSACGNALEVEEARRILTNASLNPNEARFRQLCVSLCALTLTASGQTPTEEAGSAMAEAALTSGRAANKAREWFSAQGGDFGANWLESRTEAVFVADTAGWISEIHAGKVGELVVELGGGRRRKEDVLDLQVGVTIPQPVGSRVEAGDLLATVYAKDQRAADQAMAALREAIRVTPVQVTERPLFLG